MPSISTATIVFDLPEFKFGTRAVGSPLYNIYGASVSIAASSMTGTYAVGDIIEIPTTPDVGTTATFTLTNYTSLSTSSPYSVTIINSGTNYRINDQITLSGKYFNNTSTNLIIRVDNKNALGQITSATLITTSSFAVTTSTIYSVSTPTLNRSQVVYASTTACVRVTSVNTLSQVTGVEVLSTATGVYNYITTSSVYTNNLSTVTNGIGLELNIDWRLFDVNVTNRGSGYFGQPSVMILTTPTIPTSATLISLQGESLLTSNSLQAQFLRDAQAELPNTYYYGGDPALSEITNTPLTNDDGSPLEGY